jgi:hypothetical protein
LAFDGILADADRSFSKKAGISAAACGEHPDLCRKNR